MDDIYDDIENYEIEDMEDIEASGLLDGYEGEEYDTGSW